ncbi:MAG: hypothetical protein WCJ39_10735, partial [bacterium]
YNPSKGCHETNDLNTSCSIMSFSIVVAGSLGFRLMVLAISVAPNNHPAVSLDFLDRSKMFSVLERSIPRSPKLSNPHALMSHSSDFLLITLEHLLIKFSRLWYAQFFFLSSWIVSPISRPSPLIHKNHSLISFWMAAT